MKTIPSISFNLCIQYSCCITIAAFCLFLASCRDKPIEAPPVANAKMSTDLPSRQVDTLALSNQVFNSYKPGLSIRIKPEVDAEVVAKIPYGAEVLPDRLTNNMDWPTGNAILIDGMQATWVKVKYKSDTGYVLDLYLSEYAPPKLGTASLSEWIEQISKPFEKIFVGRRQYPEPGQEVMEISRQIYANGAVLTEGLGYEYNYTTLQLPLTHVLQVYNAIQQLSDFKTVFDANKTLQSGNYPGTDTDAGFDWKVTYSGEEVGGRLQKIEIEWTHGRYSFLRLDQGEMEVIITYGGGV